MSYGKVVMCNLEISKNEDKSLLTQIKESPVVNINKYNLKSKLDELLKDKSKIKETSEATKKYWKKHHSLDSCIPKLISDYRIIYKGL